MSLSPYDQACRYLARWYALEVLAWLLRLSPGDFVFERWLDTRSAPFPGEADRTRDTVAFLRDERGGGVPWAVLLEFQLTPDPLMFGRSIVYMGQLWLDEKPSPERGDRFELGVVVVNLTGQGNASRTMSWPEAGMFFGLTAVERNLAGWEASTLLAEVEGGPWGRMVLAWLPLLNGGDDAEVIRRWVEVASADPDGKRKADLGGLALVFAEAAGRANVWEKALEGWNVIQSQVVLKWQAQARVEGQVEMLLDLLAGKFETVPDDLVARVRTEEDTAALRSWAVLAGRASSLEQFRRAAQL